MSDTLVAGAADPVTTPDGRTWLFPATASGVWYFVARRPPVATGPDGRPVLGLVRRRRVTTEGGTFSVVVELAAVAPDADEEQAWAAAVGAAPGERLVFTPLPLRAGQMTVEVAGQGPAAPPDRLGTAVSAAADLVLDAAQADAFAAALRSGAGPPVTLRFEHRYDVALPDGDAMTPGVADLSRSLPLAELRDLDPDAHVADVLGDAELPLSITCVPDPRVHRCTCQYGYRRPDGTTGGGSVTAAGAAGLRLRELVRWDPGGDPPATVEIRYALDWADPGWPASTGTAVLSTAQPCLSHRINPALSVGQVAVLSDLGCAGPGSFATISWQAGPIGPDRPARRSGSVLVEGADAPAGLLRELVSFPAGPVTVFIWTAELVHPDGARLSGRGGFVVGERAEVRILRADLTPVTDLPGRRPHLPIDP